MSERTEDLRYTAQFMRYAAAGCLAIAGYAAVGVIHELPEVFADGPTNVSTDYDAGVQVATHEAAQAEFAADMSDVIVFGGVGTLVLVGAGRIERKAYPATHRASQKPAIR